MSPYEYLGVAIVIFSTLATLIVTLYLAFVGLRTMLDSGSKRQSEDIPGFTNHLSNQKANAR